MADEYLLRTPARWIEELHSLVVDRLDLSFHPNLNQELPRGRPLSDICDDLIAGAWLVCRPGRDDDFRLVGTEFELRVVCRPAKISGRLIAHVRRVDEAREVPRRAGWIKPRCVEFYKLWDEVECDLLAIEEALARRLAVTDGRQGRPIAQQELRHHQELHGVVRRQYSELRVLIDLLEQRPARPEVAVSGVVFEGGGGGRRPLVIVETGDRKPPEFRGKRVSLTLADGRTFNTTIAQVRDSYLYIVEPRDWPGQPGARVDVAGIPPFGLRRNSEALEDFLNGRIEGAWHDLARLLCRPVDLAIPPLPPLPMFYCDADQRAHPLNDEQRAAVTGAVTSPHAFLVQGPPGTGKTEVISETVQQLVGRGERVLLLAPAHVAVDEVLKRVGAKPGIRPLRITFSDDKVDADVHPHLPKHVGVELANRVLRPTGSGQAERWASELPTVDRQLTVLTLVGDTADRLATARSEIGALASVVAHTGERLSEAKSDMERAVLAADMKVAAARRRLDEVRAAETGAADAAAELHATWQPAMDRTRAEAIELASAVTTESDAIRRADNAVRAYRTWQAQHSVVLAEHDERVRQLRASADATHQRVAEASVVADSAARVFADVQANSHWWGQLPELVGVGQRARACRALEEAREARQRLADEAHTREQAWWQANQIRNEVDGRGHTYGEGTLRGQAARNRDAAARATDHRVHVVRRLFDMLALYGGEAPAIPAIVTERGEDGVTAYGVLADAVSRVIDSAEQPEQVSGIDQELAAWSFDGMLTALSARVVEVASARVAARAAHRALLTADAELTARATELANLRAETEPNVARLATEDTTARERLNQHQALMTRLSAEHDVLIDEQRELGLAGSPEELAWLRRRQYVLQHLPALETRWRELIADRTDDQLTEDIQTAALRATNLVCATTQGIVSRGSQVVRNTDFDTLIVDEASRVTDSEFLIGAVKARRWVLVGDEHQLPPHVDQDDEHFLHALFALYRHHRGAASTLGEAVDQLADYWREDAEQREFRNDAVRELAEQLVGNGLWEDTFQERMAHAYREFAKRGAAKRRKAKRSNSEQADAELNVADPDQMLLRTMNHYLVRSLFERVVQTCGSGLKQRLKWQRRMIAPLAKIVSKPIYGGDYISPPDSELAKAGARPLVVPNMFDRPAVLIDTSRYRDAVDQPAKRGHGFENKREQKLVLRTCEIYHEELNRIGADQITVSLLSFYRAQAQALDDELDRRAFPLFNIQVVDTVDRIQGQQADLVVISFVRARERGAIGPRFGTWLQDLRRLNVACTRARRALVLVGHADTLHRLGTQRDGTPRDDTAVPAVRFYANLFRLFDGAAAEFLVVNKLDLGNKR